MIAQLRERLRIAIAVLRPVWSPLPRGTVAWGIGWVMLVVVQGFLPPINLLLTGRAVNAFMQATQHPGSWTSLQPVLSTGGLLLVVVVLGPLGHTAGALLRRTADNAVSQRLTSLFLRRAASVAFAEYDSAEFYDRLHRSRAACNGGLRLLDLLASLCSTGIAYLTTAFILARYGLWLPIVVTICALLDLAMYLYEGRLAQAWSYESTDLERRRLYYDSLLTTREAATEVRVFNLADHFVGLHDAVADQLHRGRLRLELRQGGVQLLTGMLGTLVGYSVIAWFAYRVWMGTLAFGDLTILVRAFQQGRGVTGGLGSNVSLLRSGIADLTRYVDFLTAKEAPALTGPLPERRPEGHELHLERVTFTYPGQRSPAVSDLTLRIPAGQITAIMGANGSGKSTVVKLLCGLYLPTTGRVLIDGTDLRQVSLVDLWRIVSIVTQDPMRYCASGRENIALGDIARVSDDGAVRQGGRDGGADDFLRSLPAGYDTMLGPAFAEGTELSGGQWQRLALARAQFRQSPILILDEPASALDPWEESAWMERLRASNRERTVVIVTHRVATAMQADLIHVMHDGRVVESGPPLSLLAQGGIYARSWSRSDAAPDVVPSGDGTLASRHFRPHLEGCASSDIHDSSSIR